MYPIVLPLTIMFNLFKLYYCLPNSLLFHLSALDFFVCTPRLHGLTNLRSDQCNILRSDLWNTLGTLGFTLDSLCSDRYWALLVTLDTLGSFWFRWEILIKIW